MSNIDDAILKHADSMSPDEISMMLGAVISPAAVAARTQSLLKAKDWLTDAQEDQLITLRMKEMLADITSKDYKYLDVKLRTLIALGDRIDRRKKATEVDLNTLYGNQAVIMGQAIELALQKAMKVLREAHPELEESEIREALRLALPEATYEIQSRTIDAA